MPNFQAFRRSFLFTNYNSANRSQCLDQQLVVNHSVLISNKYYNINLEVLALEVLNRRHK